MTKYLHSFFYGVYFMNHYKYSKKNNHLPFQNHGSLKHGCPKIESLPASNTAIFHWTMDDYGRKSTTEAVHHCTYLRIPYSVCAFLCLVFFRSTAGSTCFFCWPFFEVYAMLASMNLRRLQADTWILSLLFIFFGWSWLLSTKGVANSCQERF